MAADDRKVAWGFGGLTLKNRIVMGPMAGITDLPFRLLAWEMGAGLVYTEMISAMALVYENARTRAMLRLDASEGPVSVQLFGSDPEVLAKAAALVLEAPEVAPGGRRRVAALDLNAGCPTPKIVRNGEGSALMRKPQLLSELVRALVSVAGPAGVPVTVKIRAGWDDAHRNAVEAARVAEAAGAAMVAVHGRTREQFYRGKADWGIIRAVRDAVGIPVTGNGDVFGPADAEALRRQTGCDGVMIARGALGNPWLVRQAVAHLAGEPVPLSPSTRERLDFLLRHLSLQVNHLGEYYGVREMRKHVAWYLKGLPGATAVKLAAQAATTEVEVRTLLERYRDQVG